jgi:hypothetical protein
MVGFIQKRSLSGGQFEAWAPNEIGMRRPHDTGRKDLFLQLMGPLSAQELLLAKATDRTAMTNAKQARKT